MSYKAFYRRYRPSSFEEVVGQENIVKTLVNLIKMKKISHGYLFCGPRGTGKTSMAKIFANALNCIHTIELEKTCDNCLQNSNKSIDIIEIDAASNNSVNDIRTIREQVEFAPTNSPYKIYIVDEVHMLSKSAFNALLMTLEEPPAHAIFIFATTNPDSIPDTILSRVQRYNFKRIPKQDLIERLKFVFDQENVKYDKESIETISFLANGSLRDALSIADQVNAYSNSDITFEKISKVFGLSTIESQVKFINLIAQKKLSESLEFFEKLIEEGIDYSRFVFSLIELLKNFLIYKKTQNADLITLSNIDILEKINLTNKAAYLLLDIFTPLLKEIKYSDLPEHLIQLTIIKVCSLEEEFYENQNEEPIKEDKKEEHKYKDITEEYFVNEVNKNEEIDLEKELLLKINNNQNFIKKEFDTRTILDGFSTIEIENSFKTIKEEILNNKLDEIDKKNNDEEAEFNNNKNDFFTKELNINDDELNKSDFQSVDFKNVTEEIINNATEALNVSNEEDWGKEEVNEELLLQHNTNKQTFDTNEINVFNLDKPEMENNEKTLEEQIIENTKEFEIENNVINEKVNKPSHKLSQLEIINLFLLHKKDTSEIFKKKLENASFSNEEYDIYSVLLREVRFICSSNDFILVSSEEDWVIEDINEKSNELGFKKMIKNCFGNNIHFYAITKKDYILSKELFKELKESNKMPQPQPLSNFDYDDEEKKKKETLNEMENKSKLLFGNIFSRKKE